MRKYILLCLLLCFNSASARKSKLLDLSFMEIVDVSDIKIPQRIRTLFLNDNLIENVDELSLPSRLKTLDLSDNEISDISGLIVNEGLKNLFIGGNPITNYSSLKSFTEIELLSLTDSGLNNSNFSFENTPLNILTLAIPANNFVNLDLSEYTNLVGLNIKSNEALDYSQTFLPSSLKSIAIGNVVGPDDFTDLVLPESLETISLFADFLSIEELATLTFPPNVKKIDLNQNLLTTLDGIEFPGSLRILKLKKNRFSKAEKKKIRKRFRTTKVKVKL